MKMGWKIKILLQRSSWESAFRKRVLEWISKRASSSISRVISNYFPLNNFSPTSLHTCAHPPMCLRSAAWGFPHICCYSGPTPQKVKDSDTLMPPGASRFREAPVVFLRAQEDPPCQKLIARFLNALTPDHLVTKVFPNDDHRTARPHM